MLAGLLSCLLTSLPRAPPFLPQRSPGDTFDVAAYGAKGDNATDNTAAFRKALAAASASLGGVVFAGPGLYRFAGNLSVPPGVTLRGSYNVVPSHDIGNGQALLDGTVLIPLQGRGVPCELECKAAFITVGANGLVQGLVILHDEQERVQRPVPYPWAIYLGDPAGGQRADNAAVVDVELLGAWNGIAAIAAHRHYIARIQGQPLNIGVWLDETYDIGRIEDVHFNPWFSSHRPFVYHQTTFGRAFVPPPPFPPARPARPPHLGHGALGLGVRAEHVSLPACAQPVCPPSTLKGVAGSLSVTP